MGERVLASGMRTSVHPSYQRTAFASNTTSPNATFRPQSFGAVSTSASNAQIYGTSPVAERRPLERPGAMPVLSASTSDPATLGSESRPAGPAILIRRLPRSTGADSLRSLLTFAGDILDVEFVRALYAEDQGFATAIATFGSQAGALEAQQRLNGKANATKEANMVIEIYSTSLFRSLERRNTNDGVASRTQTSSASSGASGGGPPGRSRFGSSFQGSDQISSPLPTPSSAGSGEFPIPETSPHFQTLFSPHSPLANGVEDRHRVSGKSVINDDSADDETGELLRDPVAYAQGGQQQYPRTQVPVSRFGSLSLSTSNGNVTSPSNRSVHSPMSTVSPTSSSQSRNQYPPVNPADQNAPCNTLYVGNLPVDTSEDELKAIFSKQRGYKRLCFRTKQNGPMCFVEFEDVSFATKALHELYGFPLHNSVKGGIRLSFSKNPLGVRTGQMGAFGPNQAMNPHAMAPGFGAAMAGTNFSTVSGPPPGIDTPPVLAAGGGYRMSPPSGASPMENMFSNPFSMPPQDFASQLSSRTMSGGLPPNMGNGSYGRDHRGGYSHDNGYSEGQVYSDYNLGR